MYMHRVVEFLNVVEFRGRRRPSPASYTDSVVRGWAGNVGGRADAKTVYVCE